MEYKKLNKKNMPPVDNHFCFLLWLGANESDGGVATTAKRCQYGDSPPYIRYLRWNGWKVLPKSHYKTCLWATLEMPEQVKRKLERAALRKRERMQSKEKRKRVIQKKKKADAALAGQPAGVDGAPEIPGQSY